MGLTDFIKKIQQKRKAKKIQRANEGIANNLYLLSYNKISLAECISTLGYFTEEIIATLTGLDKLSERTANIAVCYYLMVFKTAMLEDENEKLINEHFTLIIVWVIDFIFENNSSLKKEERENFEFTSKQTIKKLRVRRAQEGDTLLEIATDLIYGNYERLYSFDISERKEAITDILASVTEKFEYTLQDWDSTVIKEMYFKRQFRSYEDVGFGWY